VVKSMNGKIKIMRMGESRPTFSALSICTTWIA